MLIGYTNEMTDQHLAELADWADYNAKDVPNPTWKRAYVLIREGSDLLLRRRALTRNEENPTAAFESRSFPLPTISTDCSLIAPHTPHVKKVGK
jgi:hypothetical protein